MTGPLAGPLAELAAAGAMSAGHVATAPFLAARRDSVTAVTGLGIVEDIQTLHEGVASGSWIEAGIGGVATALDAVGLWFDPVGTVLSWGISWLIEHVQPLREALDAFAGDPDQVRAHAATWRAIGSGLTANATELRDMVGCQLSEWHGRAADFYRERSEKNIVAIDGLGRAAGAMGSMVEMSGLLVGAVRTTVRELVAQAIATLAWRVPRWIATGVATAGAATPAVALEVAGLIAKFVNMIASLVRALLASLRRLVALLAKLGGLIAELGALLRGLRGFAAGARAASGATHGIPLAVKGNRIQGLAILKEVKELYEPFRKRIAEQAKNKVYIVSFEAAPENWGADAALKASWISAQQKVKHLGDLGFDVKHVFLQAPSPDMAPAVYKASAEKLQWTLARFNEDPNVLGVVVQMPPPAHLREHVAMIRPELDIDALTGRASYAGCATAEGIHRVAEPYLADGAKVAVVGSEGFVGKGVVSALERGGVNMDNVMRIDLHTPRTLADVPDADVVISVANQGNILDHRHLRPGQTVIDSGFVPQADGSFLGNVNRAAYDVPARVTPVPGGIGPVEMAILSERLVQKVAPEAPSWRLAKPAGE
jgi:5,10-methylene-tetrahydrofolate dehydrogenase/methenyl tetrahydrofolate cyclohydrolase